jgi:uncharacterized protein YjbI with pentapeptide repeats
MNESRPAVEAPELPKVISGRHYTSSHRGLELSDTIYKDCNFDHLSWSGCRLSNVRFVNCRFEANCFERCELINLVYEDCNIEETEWTDCSLRGMSFARGSIRHAVWTRSPLKDLVFANMTGSVWRFEAIRAAHVSFVKSECTGVELRGGLWSDASWIQVELAEVRIDAAELTNFIVGQSVCKRCEITDCRGINVRWIASQIEGMAVRKCELKQAAWSHCTWTSGEIGASRLPLASFDHAKVSSLSVRNSELPQAMFDHAIVEDCDFHGLNAPRVSFREARVARVRLSGAQMQGLDARGALLDQVDLNGSDCRSGVLVGQPERAWHAADTRHAAFDTPVAEDDRLWRQRTQPGARGV